MKTSSYRHVALIVIAVWLLNAREAQAYLDPGAGSIIFQILIAGLIGGSFAVKLAWRHIVRFFKALFSKRDPK